MALSGRTPRTLRLANVGCLALLLMVQPACANQAAALEVLQQVEAGVHSHVDEPLFMVITNSQDFVALYQRIHASRLLGPTPPDVDFRARIVVAVFMGEKSTGGYAITLDRVTVENRVATIVFTERHPSKGSSQAAMVTTPYALATLQRGDCAAVRFVNAAGKITAQVPLDHRKASLELNSRDWSPIAHRNWSRQVGLAHTAKAESLRAAWPERHLVP